MLGMKCSTMIVMATALVMGLGSLLARPAAPPAAAMAQSAPMTLAAR